MTSWQNDDEAPLPAGKYFMVLWGVADEFGGMTTMSLHRAGAFKEYGGRDAAIITFEPKPSYEKLLQQLVSQGKIAPGTQVLNVFQYYRGISLRHRLLAEPFGPIAEDQGSVSTVSEVLDDEGLIFSRALLRPDGTTVASRTYYREDGTEFLRDESPLDHAGRSLGRYLSLIDETGRVVDRWRAAGDFYRSWIQELASHEATTLIVDSAFASKVVAPLEATNTTKIMVLHSGHVAGGGQPFQGKIVSGKKAILENVGAWDGIVFLTAHQRQDFELRFGTADNLFTISNSRNRAAHLPAFERRQSKRGVMVCRLEAVKNVHAAIDVMALVHNALPDVTLDIYGSGSLKEELQSKIDSLSLSKVVRLRGHTPDAALEFDSARFSLLTSRNEGQGLVLMESLGRGCPAVAFDIQYGPSDIIDEGETGYLVPGGDASAAAERIVRICTDNDLSERLSATAWAKSVRFSDSEIIRGWAKTITTVRQQKAGRLVLSDLRLDHQELTFLPDGGLEIAGTVAWTQMSGPAAQEILRTHLVVGRRASGKPLFVPAEIHDRKTGRLSFRAVASDSVLDQDVDETNNELDIFLQIQGGNILRTFRVGFPCGETRNWRPYATVYGALSLKFS
jgi:poly(glycerol-phosphate) alpha-glucosyltransferase